jgi:hypothetical protein
MCGLGCDLDRAWCCDGHSLGTLTVFAEPVSWSCHLLPRIHAQPLFARSCAIQMYRRRRCQNGSRAPRQNPATPLQASSQSLLAAIDTSGIVLHSGSGV